MQFGDKVFANQEVLTEALKAMGFETVETGENLPLNGWDKREKQVADVIVRKTAVQKMHLLGDIGFQKTDKGYVAVIDDMDLDYKLGRDFVTRLQTSYHEIAAQKMAQRLNGTILRERVGSTVKIRIKY